MSDQEIPFNSDRRPNYESMWRATARREMALKAECARLRGELEERKGADLLNRNAIHLQKEAREKAEAELKEALDALREFVNGGDRDGFWGNHWHRLYDKARALLARLRPPTERNQCDGCAAGIPVDANGNHRMGAPGKYPDTMGCTKHLYEPHPPTESEGGKP